MVVDKYWCRKCQECGHKQRDTKPAGPPDDDYCARLCERCKCMALDYGNYQYTQN